MGDSRDGTARTELPREQAGRAWPPLLDRRTARVLVGLLIVAAIIRLVSLTEEPLHIDEARQAGAYRLSASEAVEGSWGQNQPPADHLIGWSVSHVLGENPFSYRLPSAVFGLLGVAFLFVLLFRFAGMAAALGGGSFLAFSPLHVEYSQYARHMQCRWLCSCSPSSPCSCFWSAVGGSDGSFWRVPPRCCRGSGR